MSYIKNKDGYVFNAGYFLAHEECERKTYTIPASMGVDAGDGAKYVPAGTPYPSDDSSAIGLVYEDTDVSFGDAAGSIVTKGTVYNDRLPITDVDYDEATLVGTENPSALGLYEKNDSDEYVLTEDTTVEQDKTYYEKVITRVSDTAKSAMVRISFVDEPTVTR